MERYNTLHLTGLMHCRRKKSWRSRAGLHTSYCVYFKFRWWEEFRSNYKIL